MAALAALARIWACTHEHHSTAPKLADFPERHPVKTMRDLVAEMMPAQPPLDRKPAEGWGASAERLVNQVLALPADEAVKAIDLELAANRAGHYEARLANFLWDMRDLFAGPAKDAPREEVLAYAEWRLQALSSEKRGLPPKASKIGDGDPPSWYGEQEKLAWLKQREEERAALRQRFADFDTPMAGASPGLQAHWMVQRGGSAFRRGMLEDAAMWFGAVCRFFPGHPRRETALFMLARCRVEQARQESRFPSETPRRGNSPISDARTLFQAYAHEFPKGRFALDAIGWEGALLSIMGSPKEAIREYLKLLDDPAHPEHIASACREIERCLVDALDENPRDENWSEDRLPIQEIAKRPIAAARVMAFLLDGAAAMDYSRWPYTAEFHNVSTIVEDVRARLARSRSPALLAELASAVAREQSGTRQEVWQPQLLAILAWAATENGEHVEAVRLCERSAALLEKSDDLNYCRAVALQRAGSLDDAVKTCQQMRERFPKNRLSAELGLRLAKVLHASKREADAWLVLSRELDSYWGDRDAAENPAGVGEEDRHARHLHSWDELAQWRDTLEHFMPVEKLEPAMRTLTGEGKLTVEQCRKLIARHLVAERWPEVRRLSEELAKLPEPELPWGWGDDEQRGIQWITAHEQGQIAVALATQHERLKTAGKDSDKAAIFWELAHEWEAGRGLVTLPNLGGAYMEDDMIDIELRLRTNAITLGYSEVQVNRELEGRDELKHAFDHCLRAADQAPRSELAAKALHKALECLKRMAEVSPYARVRAFEKDWSALSRQIYDRLKAECPDSPEAQRLAAWWSFPAPRESHGWMPGNGFPAYNDDGVAWAIMEVSRPNAMTWEEVQKRDAARAGAQRRILDLGKLAEERKVDEMRAACAALRRELAAKVNDKEWNLVISALDEAELLAHHPPADFTTFDDYLTRRFSKKGLDEVLPGDEVDPLADFMAYHRTWTQAGVAPVQVEGEVPVPRWTRKEQQWRAFLSAYPNSLKREAAQFQLARAMVRQHRGWVHLEYYGWPEAPFVGRYVRMAVERERPFDAKAAMAALDEYDKAFPKGRYSADIRFLRGGVAVDAGDYVKGLEGLCATLDDKSHGELHYDAALHLAQCFDLLHDPEKRLPLARAIVGNESALRRFRAFARSPTCGHRLRMLEEYVEAVVK